MFQDAVQGPGNCCDVQDGSACELEVQNLLTGSGKSGAADWLHW